MLALKAQPVRAQVGVIGEKSQRDGRRQTRVVRGDSEELRVYTVNHHQAGAPPPSYSRAKGRVNSRGGGGQSCKTRCPLATGTRAWGLLTVFDQF